MVFQESAQTLRSRLHMGEVKPQVIIGAIVIVAVVVTSIAFVLAQSFAMHRFEIEKTTQAKAAENAYSSSSSSASLPSLSICVHVSGAVVTPGVYELQEGSRVGDAIALAGGMTEGAAPDALNLARTLNDGEQIIVLSADQLEQSQTEGSSAVGIPSAPNQGKVNINTADSATLQTLDGVGESTAQRIIDDRKENGPFATPEDLMRVSGIGEKKFEALKDSIYVG